METFLILIVGVLVAVAIYQGIQIKKLRRQTIQAFLKVCERAFKKGDDKKIWNLINLIYWILYQY